MNKLPVFRTVGRTFGFVVVRRFFSLLRLIWLPTLLSVFLSLLPLFYVYNVYGVVPDDDAEVDMLELFKTLNKSDDGGVPKSGDPAKPDVSIETEDVAVTADVKEKTGSVEPKDAAAPAGDGKTDGVEHEAAPDAADGEDGKASERDDVKVKVDVDGFIKITGKIDKKLTSKIEEDVTYNTLEVLSALAQILLGAMVAISVHRMILLDDLQKGVFFYWRLTREEWLYMLAWILYFILILAAAVLPIAGYVGYLSQADAGGAIDFSDFNGADVVVSMMREGGRMPLAIVVLLSVSLFLITAVRFGLVFPIIVAEGRVSFWRSWVVTRGNFWRLFGYWIVVWILAVVLIVLVIAVLVAAIVGMFGGILAGGQTVGALSVLVLAVPAAIALAVYLVVGITIFIAGMSFAYRALAGDGAHAVDDGDDHSLGHH